MSEMSCGKIMTEKFMKEALKEAYKAYHKNETPIGAVAVYQNKIIARAHNLRETKQNTLMHAELQVIEKACKRLGNLALRGGKHLCDFRALCNVCRCNDTGKGGKMFFMGLKTTDMVLIKEQFIFLMQIGIIGYIFRVEF